MRGFDSREEGIVLNTKGSAAPITAIAGVVTYTLQRTHASEKGELAGSANRAGCLVDKLPEKMGRNAGRVVSPVFSLFVLRATPENLSQSSRIGV